MAEIGTSLLKATFYLLSGKAIAIPTETVYGLAANALEEEAVKQIYLIKNRPSFNPLIVHIGTKDQLPLYTKDIPKTAQQLAEKFWPGPLTLLLPKTDKIPNIVTASLPNVAIRMPSHPLTLRFLESLHFPLAAPSANPFGYISPTTPEHVQNQIGDKIDYILNGGPCTHGIESTIVGFENETPVIYRLGAITPEEIKNVTGKVLFHKKKEKLPQSPGALLQHYSPSTPLYLTTDIKNELKKYRKNKTGVISFSTPYTEVPAQNQVTLSASANLNEAAHNLYSALHYLDHLNLDCIIAEHMPDTGIGMAINDRLYRASKK